MHESLGAARLLPRSFRDLRGGTAGEIATAKELLDTRAIT